MKPFLVLGALAAAACSRSREAPDAPGKLSIADVPCLVVAGQLGCDDCTPLHIDIQGPQACKRSLELYFHAYPDDRIASVIPIHYPSDHPGHPGTERLLILRTPGAGPWPRARDLEVRSLVCAEPYGSRFGSRWCAPYLDEHLSVVASDYLWIPIVRSEEIPIVKSDEISDEVMEAGTESILILRRRRR